MEVKEIEPVIHSLIVVVEGLKYKDQVCTIEVECVPSSIEDKENAKFIPISATCQDPSFTMGGSFWEDNFGKRQTDRIKELCDLATKKFVEEDSIEEKIAKELRDILVRCEDRQEYHQAIIELKIKITEGL